MDRSPGAIRRCRSEPPQLIRAVPAVAPRCPGRRRRAPSPRPSARPAAARLAAASRCPGRRSRGPSPRPCASPPLLRRPEQLSRPSSSGLAAARCLDRRLASAAAHRHGPS
ncbi:hypothetical protein BRADI_4g05247v3 [Brachypodium distachyon]|uniref:Uncharacterized protein n=1 Tax=Brachypodium distachyon TaxID=15368 RepID=A0A2K2CKL7_BRADI|nr:hypothetical protein BRADI_4g05247v3 [Brachypodium distachyon]